VGSVQDGPKQVVKQMIDWGGKPESTVLVFGNKLPCINAAFANSAMSHGLDYDDTHDEAVIHGGSVMLPVCLSLSERRGKVNGKEFIAAIAVGIDLQSRLALACTVPFSEAGWHPTTLYGTFGAAAAAGRILGLDEEGMLNALGIAYSQASGNLQALADGVLSKRLQPGFSVRAGILAALLAESGVTGARPSLEGKYGLYNVYLNGQYKPEVITSELGKNYEMVNLGFKAHSCCRLDQAFVDAALGVTLENDIKPDEVESIIAYTGQQALNIPGSPKEVKQQPKSVVAAQFSLYYGIANALVRRQCIPSNYTDEAIKDPTVLAISAKVEPKLTPEFTRKGMEPAKVEVKTKRGTFVKQVDYCKGHLMNPLTMDDIVAKVKDCVTMAARPIKQENMDKAIEMIKNLEQVDDVSQLVGFFVGEA